MNKKIFLFLLTVTIFCGCASKSGQENQEQKELSPLELMKEGKIDDARSAFMLPYDIDAVDSDGNTVLHLAAKQNASDLCLFFMIKGADADLKNNESDTPLHIAIKNGAYESAEAITSINCESLFSRDANGMTALDLGLTTDAAYYDLFITTKTGEIRDTEGQSIVHYFVRTRNLKGIQQCIKKSIPISVKDNNGKTPLDVAFDLLNDDLSVQIAANLILGGAEEVETDFAYFQDAVATRNLSGRLDDGQTPLHLASIMGHSAIAGYLLENNADPTAQDSSGATPLHEAVRYGNLEIAKLLLDADADINAKDNLGKTPIMLIFPKDKLFDTYQLLASYRADLTQKDMFGDTILHTATMMNVEPKIIELLINKGADVNARNKEGSTPLSIAVQKNDIPTVRLLTSKGADIHTQDTNGYSPLMIALAGSQEMMEAMINSNNAISQDSEGNTPLHIALINDAPLEKVQYLISLTDDVNIRNRDGNSPLFISVLKNRQKVGEMLLTKKADIFATNTNNNSPLRLALKYGGIVQDWIITSKTIKSTDGSGNTVLHYAAEWQYGDAINFLLTKGAKISAKNANGETPLFSAAKTNNPQIIQIIVDGGADIHARDNLGSTAIHTAVRWDAPLSVDKLISLGINVNVQNSAGKSPLSEAVVASKYDVAQKLLQYGANPNSCDTNGVTILMDAIRGCNKDIVQLLLNNGANPNVQEVNGRNAYHEAAYMGEIEIIQMIREAGGNPLARDKQGKTPFSIVMNKDNKIIHAVLGTNTNITDSDGNSPLHIIVKNKGSVELLKDLISNGYPLDTRNSSGYTALNYAIEADDVQRATVLLENGADPFLMIDKKGNNGVTIALNKNNNQIIQYIVKYAGDKTDVQGNTILHYAAKTSSAQIIKTLLSYGIDKNVTNVSGDTPYNLAVRWKRGDEIINMLGN